MITWRALLKRFLSDPVAICAAVVLLALILMAVLAPVLAPQNPYDLMQLDIMDSEM
ncbi:ABC transporter permease, partial [Devosia neptuniae]|nr:ABC transporter permease [Devosia neptuniae]